MLTSVILVNYKSSALLIDCLNSIYQFPTNNLEIIVVDNGSDDNVHNKLSTQYPSVIFIQMGYNAGFARANNAGIKKAKGDFILLLNSDTIVLNDAINKCSTQFEATNYVACGVQLLNADQTPQISGNFAMKGGLNYLLPIPFFGDILKSIATLIKIKKPNIPEAKGTEFVDWINGAFLMARKQTINAAGLLDEDFFLYAEEAEWCSRLKKHGKLCIFGDINVLHLQGATANVAFGSTGQGYQNLFDKKGFQIILSNFVRIRKEFGVFWFLIMLFFYFLAIPIFLIGLSFSTFFFLKNTGLQFKHWLGYSKNVCRLILYSVRIIINQPYFYKAL
jgi:GT2 family glycosyltransferase